MKEEKTVAQISSEYGIHANQLHRWKRQALEGLPTLFERSHKAEREAQAAMEKKTQALYAEIGRLTTQVNWLKKNLVLNHSTSERRQMIEHANQHLSVREQARLLSLNRSGLYYRKQAPSREEIALKRRIDEMYTRHPFYGSRRIAVALQQAGQRISRKRVQRYMRDMGLAGIAPRKNLSKRQNLPLFAQKCDRAASESYLGH